MRVEPYGTTHCPPLSVVGEDFLFFQVPSREVGYPPGGEGIPPSPARVSLTPGARGGQTGSGPAGVGGAHPVS